MLLAALVSAAPDALTTVEAAGRAPLASATDAPQAREQATAAAVRACVSQVAGGLATAATAPDQAQLLSERILARPGGYVRRLQLLEDRQDGAAWLVRARCDVAEGTLADDLLAAGIAHRRAGLPRLVLRVKEVPLPGAPAGAVTGALAPACAERLRRSGFEVLEEDAPAGAPGPEVRVEVRATPRPGPALPAAGGALHQVTVSVSGQAVRVAGGQRLAQLEATGAPGRGFEPLEADREGQAEAGLALARAVLSQVGRAWPAATGAPVRLAVKVTGAGDYARLSAFKAALRGVRGVREVQDRAFDAGGAELAVSISGTAEAFATELATRRLEGFTVTVGTVRPDAVEVQLR
ncbi:MAG: hypothetical protein QM767_17595 [Anaeromyxobacter sp.]